MIINRWREVDSTVDGTILLFPDWLWTVGKWDLIFSTEFFSLLVSKMRQRIRIWQDEEWNGNWGLVKLQCVFVDWFLALFFFCWIPNKSRIKLLKLTFFFLRTQIPFIYMFFRLCNVFKTFLQQTVKQCDNLFFLISWISLIFWLSCGSRKRGRDGWRKTSFAHMIWIFYLIRL